jgi:NTE family protein
LTTALVLPGGASLGAVQVGMVDALFETGIRPDLMVGTSAGALNGAWLAVHPDPHGVAELADLWLSVHRREIFPFSPVQIMLGLFGHRDHVVNAKKLTHWLARRAPISRLEHARVPLHVMTTDLATGAAVMLSSGDALDALLASSAIPGIFPPVEVGGRLLVDGGIAADTPISQAVELGADTVYVLPTVGIRPDSRPTSAPAVALQALSHLLGYAADNEIAANAGRCTLYVAPALPVRDISPFDFSHSRELIDAAKASTRAWLETAKPEGRVLA